MGWRPLAGTSSYTDSCIVGDLMDETRVDKNMAGIFQNPPDEPLDEA